MKILHTADWHFGKHLYGQPLNEDMHLFLQWLYTTLQEQEIDVLLISGDIFDVSNPANTDKEQYFAFLKQIRELGVTAIITGGNHDSVSYLNSPKGYLQQDNIYVIGGATETLQDELIHLKINNEEVVICAVPFLRDKNLRHLSSEQQFNTREEAIKAGLNNHYQEILKRAKEQYPTLPIIAMGHLFAVGVSQSKSERDIHIGNAGAVEAGIFNGFDYVALGHIHKPQIIQKNEMIRYSGSPIALSFSEKKDDKQVLVIELRNKTLQQPKIIPVPKFRHLVRFTGNYKSIQEQLATAQFNSDLPAFLELHIKEEERSLTVNQSINQLIEDYNNTHNEQIINSKLSFEHGNENLNELFQQGTSIKDLSQYDVFEKRIESTMPDASEEIVKELKTTFAELIDLLQNDNQ